MSVSEEAVDVALARFGERRDETWRDAMRAALEAAEAVAGDWEYGLLNPDPEQNPRGEAHLISANREHIERQQRRGHPSIKVVRRHKATPWVGIAT